MSASENRERAALFGALRGEIALAEDFKELPAELLADFEGHGEDADEPVSAGGAETGTRGSG